MFKHYLPLHKREIVLHEVQWVYAYPQIIYL